MFSTLPSYVYTTFQNQFYTPQVPSPLSSSPLRPASSPLSPRNGNLPSRQFTMSSPTPAEKTRLHAVNQENNNNNGNGIGISQGGAGAGLSGGRLFAGMTTRSGSAQNLPVKRRGPVKMNPLIHGRDGGNDGRETRRNLFLKKIQDGREEKRWQARGGDDEIMRTIWVAEERRRAERKARDALYQPASQEEEEDFGNDEMTISTMAQSTDEDMAEELARRDQEEMEALLAMMEMDSSEIPLKELLERPDTPYGSDDDEYDHLFMDVIHREMGANLSSQNVERRDDEMMDMS